MTEEQITTATGGLKTVRIAVATGRDTSHLKEALAEAVREVNQKAAGEERGARVEVVGWYEEGAYSGFYRESPRKLLEKIRGDAGPDVIVALFHGRFGTESQEDEGTPTQEYERFAQALRQAGTPHTLLCFLDKDFNPQSPEESAQKEYFKGFRSYFLPNVNKWWWYFKKPAGLRKLLSEELWEFVRLRTKGNSSAWSKSPSIDLRLPGGWQHVDGGFLDKERGQLGEGQSLSSRDAASFFDGEYPKWRHIVSKSIRPRERVAELVKVLTENTSKGRTTVTLLIGPGGEGKSTILQQVAAELAESQEHINVIWRDLKATEPAPLRKSWLQPLLKREQQFVIVIDNADQLVEDIWESVIYLSDQVSNIHFLLASRSIDWEWARADAKSWRRTLGGPQSSPNYREEKVTALTEEDARRVVAAWEEAGAEGLGDFIKEEAGGRAAKLFRLAKEEELKNPKEGSFLGAMLEARKSDTFRDYVEDILRRLDGRAIPGGKTLQDAFSHIVALHADNLRILTRPVLSHALGCSMDELEHQVIRPLADEADLSSSVLVLARHIAIARVARQVLAEEFGVKFETSILPALARAAISKFKAKDGEMRVEELSPWNKLPRYYADELEKVGVALGLAETLAKAEPEDPMPVIAWANIYRHNGQEAEAVNVFRRRYEYISSKKLNKGFFTEWAVAESRVKNHCHDAWLTGIALSDLIEDKHPGDSTPMIMLSSLTSSFISLYEKADGPRDAEFHNPSNAQKFLAACVAARQLGLDERAQKGLRPNYNKSESIRYLNRAKELAKRVTIAAPAEAVNHVINGIRLAWELRDSDADWDKFPPTLPGADRLSFRRLRTTFE